MPVIRLEVSAELAELLDAECDLLGFDAREEYVRWILRNRAAIDGETERRQLLSEYAQRVEELEEKLDAVREGTDARADDGEDVQYHLEPNADRISDDSVGEVADELKGVQGNRLDEMARQAVAKTRRQLGTGTDTGLAYDSSTAIRSDGPRPGSDITNLDTLEVPGYDDELVERRREAVGAALAYLRDVEDAKRGDFVEELYEEYPAGYESTDGWWECIKRGLRQVDRVDGAGDDSRIWRYRDYTGRVRVMQD